MERSFTVLEPTTLGAGFPAAEAIDSATFLVSSQLLFTILFAVCIISGVHRYMKMAFKTSEENQKKLGKF